MIRIRLQITALAPLSFSARRGASSSFTDTLSYLPGTALRGAAAARYLRNLGEPSDHQFQDLFVGDGILFSNLLPQGKVENAGQRISQVLPATARSCKAYRGFLGDCSKDDPTHGAADILIHAAAFEIFRDKRLLDEVARCPRCDQPAHQFAGFYERASNAPRFWKVDVHKRHLPHVGINRRTQTAESGVLYAQQVIDEVWREPANKPHGDSPKAVVAPQPAYAPQTFSGDLIVEDSYVDFVQHTLLAEGTILWVGDSRSRGLGRIKVTQCAVIAADDETSLKSRITAFNRQFSEQTQRAFDRNYIALTLQSDTILQDEFMRPKLRLEPEDLSRAVGNPLLFQLRLVYANLGTRLVQSWNVASGYPKPDDVAMRMGSVFLFESPPDLSDELAAVLVALQEHGIGKRRNEGFGRLVICDPFHIEVQELWQTT